MLLPPVLTARSCNEQGHFIDRGYVEQFLSAADMAKTTEIRAQIDTYRE
jgi:hypothetical protein